MADVSATGLTDAIGGFIPKIDPIWLLLGLFAFLFLLLVIAGAGVFLIALKKNWIVLNYTYKIIMRRPTGKTYMTVFDQAALIKTEENLLKFRLKSNGMNFVIPTRDYIQVGNIIEGWSPTIHEFHPMKAHMVGFNKEPDPRVMAKLEAIEDEKKRNQLINDYKCQLGEMHSIYKPHIDPGVVNSAITEAVGIVKNTPMKGEWLAFLGVGIAVMIIIVVFMMSVAQTIKGMEIEEKRAVADTAMGNALGHMASVLNETNQNNLILAEALKNSAITIPRANG